MGFYKLNKFVSYLYGDMVNFNEMTFLNSGVPVGLGACVAVVIVGCALSRMVCGWYA